MRAAVPELRREARHERGPVVRGGVVAPSSSTATSGRRRNASAQSGRVPPSDIERDDLELRTIFIDGDQPGAAVPGTVSSSRATRPFGSSSKCASSPSTSG